MTGYFSSIYKLEVYMHAMHVLRNQPTSDIGATKKINKQLQIQYMCVMCMYFVYVVCICGRQGGWNEVLFFSITLRLYYPRQRINVRKFRIPYFL